MKQVFLLALSATLFSACGYNDRESEDPRHRGSATERDGREINTDTTSTNNAVNPAHTSKNSLDWSGTYKGTVPCADCQGIEMDLDLNQDFTYELKTKYLGKGKDEWLKYKGNFMWDDGGSVITLQGLEAMPTQYKVEEGRLVQLDMQGGAVAGANADKYILKKS